MKINVNGQPRDIGPGTTVAALLESLDLPVKATVVQRNDAILDRACYAETTLAENDTLELVRFVGGG